MQYIEQLLQKRKNEEDFRKLIKHLSEVYSGTSHGEKLKFGNETDAHVSMRPKFFPNFYRKAITDLSYLYSIDPIRKSTDYDFWEDNVWSKEFDLKMYEADYLARMGGTSLVVVLSTGDIYVLPRERFTAYGRTSETLAVLIEWEDKVDLYIDENEFVFISEGENIVQPHSFGKLPCVLCKNNYSSNSVYGENLGGRDVLANINTINLQFAELVYVSMLQRGQPVVQGKATNLALGPDTVVEVDPGNTFQFVSNGADIEKMRTGLQATLDGFAISLGLPKRSFNVRSSLDQISADAIYASQLELSHDRQLRQKLFKSYENRIYQLIAIDKNVEIPKVQFVDFIKPTSPSETLEKAKFESEKGLTDSETLSRNLNPSLSEPELKEILRKAKSEQTEVARKTAIIAGRDNAEDVDDTI